MKSLLSPAHGRTCRVLNHKPLKEQVRIMKKSMFALSIVAGAVAMLATGCSTVEVNKVGRQVNPQIPVLIKPQIETKNQVITGSATVHSILGIFTWGPNAQAVGVNYGTDSGVTGGALGDLLSFTAKSEIVARNAAAYEATTKAKADIILAPQYVLTTEDYFVYKSINCKVKGFPGFVKGVSVVEAPKHTVPEKK